MKKASSMAFCGLLILTVAAAAQRPTGYYATKADERAGRLTPGTQPMPQGSGAVTNAGGDTCAAATLIPDGGTNFTDTGTTVGANNTVTSIQAGCSNYTTVAGTDVIYTFTLGPVAGRANPLEITVTPSNGFDVAIYTLSSAGAGCPAGPAAAATNCVNGADAVLTDAAETITDAETDAMAPGTYFLFVDSFYSTGSAAAPNRHQGPYSLVMNRPLPVELLEFSID